VLCFDLFPEVAGTATESDAEPLRQGQSEMTRDMEVRPVLSIAGLSVSLLLGACKARTPAPPPMDSVRVAHGGDMVVVNSTARLRPPPSPALTAEKALDRAWQITGDNPLSYPWTDQEHRGFADRCKDATELLHENRDALGESFRARWLEARCLAMSSTDVSTVLRAFDAVKKLAPVGMSLDVFESDRAFAVDLVLSVVVSNATTTACDPVVQLVREGLPSLKGQFVAVGRATRADGNTRHLATFLALCREATVSLGTVTACSASADNALRAWDEFPSVAALGIQRGSRRVGWSGMRDLTREVNKQWEPVLRACKKAGELVLDAPQAAIQGPIVTRPITPGVPHPVTSTGGPTTAHGAHERVVYDESSHAAGGVSTSSPPNLHEQAAQTPELSPTPKATTNSDGDHRANPFKDPPAQERKAKSKVWMDPFAE
jgi:hypothetical protein